MGSCVRICFKVIIISWVHVQSPSIKKGRIWRDWTLKGCHSLGGGLGKRVHDMRIVLRIKWSRNFPLAAKPITPLSHLFCPHFHIWMSQKFWQFSISEHKLLTSHYTTSFEMYLQGKLVVTKVKLIFNKGISGKNNKDWYIYAKP